MIRRRPSPSPAVFKTLLGLALIGNTSFTPSPTAAPLLPSLSLGLDLSRPVLDIGDDAHTRFPSIARDAALETPYPIDSVILDETRIVMMRTVDSGTVTRTYFRDCGIPSPTATAVLYRGLYYQLDTPGHVRRISATTTGIRPCPPHGFTPQYVRDDERAHKP